MASLEPIADAAAPPKREKKSKKDKAAKSERKRARDDDDTADVDHRHKKSVKVRHPELATEDGHALNGEAAVAGEKKKDKKSKKKHRHELEGQGDDIVEVPDSQPTTESKSEKKKHKKKHREDTSDMARENERTEVNDDEEKVVKKKHKKKRREADLEEDLDDQEPTTTDKAERKKKKKSKKHREEAAEQEDEEMEDPFAEPTEETKPSTAPSKHAGIDHEKRHKRSKIHQPADIPADPQFPFFTQTVSLYEPLYPVGWAQPVTNSQTQHLRHLQNRFVPSLSGVLLDYRNVALGDKPGRQGAALDDESPATVRSQNEYAVGFGWITADVDLFVPSRGAWMEGRINLQTEGHVGVVCFGKFNASIEAQRLPPDWQWVPHESSSANGFEETASVITADEHGVVRQIHSTGHWIDGSGARVKGKVRFRIRNFDAGTSGEMSYLSLEGTMLDRQGERALVQEEARKMKEKMGKGSGSSGLALARERKKAPDFSMTKFVAEGEQPQDEDAGEPTQEIYQASRPGSVE